MSTQPEDKVSGDFLGLPFWRWDISSVEHRAKAIETGKACCFNHKIGLPLKDGKERPIFPWQRSIYDAYESKKYNWVLKATGLGLTEFTLRYILWKSACFNTWSGSVCSIITGPRIDLARESINRMRDMISGKYPLRRVTQEKFEINRVSVCAFPSNHLEAFRGVPNVKFIFIDEADFFRKIEQYEVRDVAERYIGKSQPQILFVSTPNKPGGLMERIQDEKHSLYNKLFLPYTIGVGTMFTKEQIREAMRSPSFEREYNLKYLGEIGNIFNPYDIEYCTETLGLQYNYKNENITTDPMFTRFLGVDPGFGSSQFGIVMSQMYNGMPEILFADHIERGSMTECLATVLNMAQKYRVMKIYIDGSAAGFIADLKKKYGEPRDYAVTLKKKPQVADQWIKSKFPKVVPVSFMRKHEEMLMHLEQFLQKKLIRIHPDFTKLNIALRTATSKGEKYDLDKEKTSHDDVLDALMLSLLGFYFTP